VRENEVDMRHSRSKSQHYLGIYKNLKPQTKKLLLVGVVVGFLVLSTLTIAVGFIVYKAGSLIVNTVKIENPNFEVTDIQSLITAATTLQSDVENSLISKKCRDSLQSHFTVAAFIIQPVDEIIAKIKTDCSLATEKEPALQ
jgi:hypothetical protein